MRHHSSTKDIMDNYYQKLDNLEYATRVKILGNVAIYLKSLYHREIRLVNTPEHRAFNIIVDRIEYQHHYTLGF